MTVAKDKVLVHPETAQAMQKQGSIERGLSNEADDD